ncbi:MAG TPA: hypothetical protein VNC50_09675, partial [Planctomycetia bacterium]|nr:hypothetical protein [Planctomycetia bacterium]
VVSVRTDPRTTVRGAISACRVLPPTTEAGKPQYEVTMICGVAAAVRTFVVAKLPPPDIIPVGPPAPGL